MTTLPGRYANGLVVGPATVAEVEAAPNIAALFAEYADESLVKGLPAPSAKWGVYRGLEAGGLLFPYTATVAGQLVGFITVLVSLLPRYSQPLAVAESFFGSLKAELMPRSGWHDRESAELAIGDYIEIFYNHQRRHTHNGYLSPVTAERSYREVA